MAEAGAEAGKQGKRAALRRPADWLPWLLLALSLALFAWEMRFVPPQADDAFISYRYARNLVEGRGLVYNPGERVEGYTNLLWTLLVAGGLKLGLRAEVAGHLLCLLGGAAALLFAFLYSRVGLPRSRAWLAGCAPLLLLSSPSFAIWSSSGMETPLFAAELTAALAFEAQRRTRWLTAALVAATLTRPEGALAAAVLYGFHLYRGRACPGAALRPVLVYAGVLLALTLFRLLYYHAWLPNTFYARAGGLPLESGALYLAGCLLSGPALLLVPALPGLRRGGAAWPGAALVLAFCMYIVCIGGDAFYQWRFFLPLLPALIGLAVRGCDAAFDLHPDLGVALSLSLPAAALFYFLGWAATSALIAVVMTTGFSLAVRPTRLRPMQWVMLATLACVFVWLPSAYHAFELRSASRLVVAFEPAPSRAGALAETRRFYRFGERLAVLQSRIIVAECRPGCLVAAVSIGMFGYRSRLPILDLLGIVDPVIARSRVKLDDPALILFPGHQKTDAEYVLRRRPDYVLVGRRGPYMLPALLQLLDHPQFRRRYAFDTKLLGYARRER
jgi:arabinofuranosyltransferase